MRYVVAFLVLGLCSCRGGVPPDTGAPASIAEPKFERLDLGELLFDLEVSTVGHGSVYTRRTTVFEEGIVCELEVSANSLDIYFDRGTANPVTLGGDRLCWVRIQGDGSLSCEPGQHFSHTEVGGVIHGFSWPADKVADPIALSRERALVARTLLGLRDVPVEAHGTSRTRGPLEAGAPVLGASLVTLGREPRLIVSQGPPLSETNRAFLIRFMREAGETLAAPNIHGTILSIEVRKPKSGYGRLFEHGANAVTMIRWVERLTEKCDDRNLTPFPISGEVELWHAL